MEELTTTVYAVAESKTGIDVVSGIGYNGVGQVCGPFDRTITVCSGSASTGEHLLVCTGEAFRY
jgi:hypothetical protein